MPELINKNLPTKIEFTADETQDVTTAKCGGVAYSGKSVNYYGSNFIVDLAGLKIAEQIPILYNHENEPAYRLGIANIKNDGKQLTFDGEIDKESQIGKWLTSIGAKWHFQTSIGFNVVREKMSYIDAETKENINGQVVSDCYIARESELREISLCAVGADSATSFEIKMSLDNFFKLSENEQTNGVKNMGDENKNMNNEEKTENKGFEQFNAKLDEFAKRMENLENQNKEIKAENEKLKTENEQFKAKQNRPAPMLSFGATEASAQDVISSALSTAFGYAPKEDNVANDVAAKKFKGGISIKDALLLTAKACGYNGEFIKTDNDFAEAVNTIKFSGMTNINLPLILGNLINRRILDGFNYVEQAWREIAKIIPVNDFKDVYSVRLTAKGEFEEIPAGGKIPVAGPLVEEAYKVRAKTYGMSFVLDRQTWRNDDMHVINDNAFQFGRKGGLKINDVFWSLFLNNSDFFKAENNNVLTSAGALSIDSLSNLVALFNAQVDASGAPIGIDADRLLVSPNNEVMANHLFADRDIRSNVSNKEYFTSNPHTGKYKVVMSRYLSNSKYAGYSAANYYLFGNPQFIAPVQICFLDGKETPYVEAFDAEFDTLGIRYRSYFDFGVGFADPKAGVKAVVA